jgi:hypothetical protein
MPWQLQPCSLALLLLLLLPLAMLPLLPLLPLLLLSVLLLLLLLLLKMSIMLSLNKSIKLIFQLSGTRPGINSLCSSM